MIIASWNVNSIRARLERVLEWLPKRNPDVVCLQETKVEDKAFPYDAFRELGYEVEHFGQRSYNGVAILSREPMTDIVRGMDDGVEDEQARFIGATVKGVRVFSLYIPNGSTVGSDKWEYKLAWLQRLRAWLDRHQSPQDNLVLCGDYNVAPEAIDVHDPKLWENSVLYIPEIRDALNKVLDFGLHDAYRLHVKEAGKYSWWDYQMLSFPKDYGLRIDHAFITEPLISRCTAAGMDRDERKGKRPSDHIPVWIELSE